jgi:Uma2 family endonuclease
MKSEDVIKEIELRLAVEVAQLWPLQGEWREEDYFSLPDTNRIIELSEGELIMTPLPTESHQRTSIRLLFSLYTFVHERELGVVRYAPLPVRLWPGKIREPDILFVSNEHLDRIGERVYGPPDLVVEITSPGTMHVDRVEKFSEYAKAGVEEYWIVDPDAETIEVFVLRRGAYVMLGKWGRGEVARSEVLKGFEVKVNEVMG